ncbi:MAG: hypothetical protein AAFN93_28665 [Bacteroidota bacterium]
MLKTLLLFLQLFDAVTVREDVENQDILIKSSSESTKYFLKCLAKFVEARSPIIPSFSWGIPAGKGIMDDYRPINGARFLKILEKLRLENTQQADPIRREKILKAVVKVKSIASEEEYYLLTYNQNSRHYEFPGRHNKTKDSDDKLLISQIVQEEFGGTIFYLRDIVENHTFCEFSPTYGAYSEYSISLYQPIFQSDHIAKTNNPSHYWATFEEITVGKTKQNNPIFENYLLKLNNSLGGRLNDLECSGLVD